MKLKHCICVSALFVTIALLVITLCAYKFSWGKHFPVKDVTPEEMVTILKKHDFSDVVANDIRGSITVQTKLGFRYSTISRPIPITDYENLTSSGGLVIQILKIERGLEPDRDFKFTRRAHPFNYR